MAMATTSFSTTAKISCKFIRRNFSVPFLSSPRNCPVTRCSNPTSSFGLRSTGKQLSHPLSVVVSAASTAVEAQPQVTTTASSKSLPFHIGHGFNLHRLEPGYPLIIEGINIPHERGCEAHSDGDVLLYCVVDAILGALDLPDIGQIFSDTDPEWKGAASSVFMREAMRLMHEAGYELGNLDTTLILQRPKLSPHKEAIRSNLCEQLGADP